MSNSTQSVVCQRCGRGFVMPDAQAQADKMASIASGVAHGFTRFNLFPLCADEAWSHVQLVLDVEYVHAAWATQKSTTETHRAEEAFHTMTKAIQENRIVGEMEDTILHLREYYTRSPLPRGFSSGQWNNKGRPDPLSDADAYAQELIAKADFEPPQDKWRKVRDVYYNACRKFSADPMGID